MSIDYKQIANDQARLARSAANSVKTLAGLYADRSHFVFELLQNAEDAIRKRSINKAAPRAVTFVLSEDFLRVAHYGKPFDRSDVEAICSVGESTKQITDIGRFGIGFKSVYAFTERPQIHSGDADFAIEDYLRPVAIAPISRDEDETVFVIPISKSDTTSQASLADGFARLSPSALLFLREIDSVHWKVEGGRAGLLLREERRVAPGIRRVTALGQEDGKPADEAEWLVFSRPVKTTAGAISGYVETAYSLERSADGREVIRRIEQSPLAVFFPTVLETNLGFLIQGPYRTTPSRDNVPPDNEWNQRCVRETSILLVESLFYLRDQNQLGVDVLRCLPLDRGKFTSNSMFAPLFDAVTAALRTERLLPRFGGGFTSAEGSKIARSKELRELFDEAQLSALCQEDGKPLCWLSADISQDRTPELRRYLIDSLDVEELRPEELLRRLDEKFLEGQSDSWIQRLYAFLEGQPGLHSDALKLPIIRVSDGSHRHPFRDGQPLVFLPGDFKTAFPLVRASVCESVTALRFLQAIGLTTPDPVDDVVRNLLPKYREDHIIVEAGVYESDIERIRSAFATDSKTQREKLVAALRTTAFVIAIDGTGRQGALTKPGDVYLAVDRLKKLFDGVAGVKVVDDSYSCLRGEDTRDLLIACGAARSLRLESVASAFSWEDRRAMRRAAGYESMTYEFAIHDNTIRGLTELLTTLASLSASPAIERTKVLWDALEDLEQRNGSGVFSGTYQWFYHHFRRTQFDAEFIRVLNEMPWIPDELGNLRRPESVRFEELGWNPNAFLQTRVRFRPPIIDQLAAEAGIEPGVLDLLKESGITSTAVLRRLLQAHRTNDAVKGGHLARPEVAATDGNADESRESPVEVPASPAGDPAANEGDETRDPPNEHPDRAQIDKGRARSSPHKSEFISYVAVQSTDDRVRERDSTSYQRNMDLEARAISYILRQEPAWNRTSGNNAGFDLYQGDEQNSATQWCEVKAMSGGLSDGPVGLSRVQFEYARDRGEAYWLYVVENAGSETPRLIKIQNPYGRAKTFTFDRGWLEIAEKDDDSAF